MELIIATANPHKIKEFEQIIPPHITLLSALEAGVTQEVEENEVTLEGNALLKARFIHKQTQKACFADDTGLFVEHLDGQPGIFSARFAQKEGIISDNPSQDNITLLLQKLSGETNRKAYFRTVIALIDQNSQEYLFEGIIHGEITICHSGMKGFGYDPVFVPDGYNQTFAELSSIEKNAISHRGRATAKLIDYLKTTK
ncbi:MAG: RdgB/HAM1 family non-canonical purine NTP pyrophosphatase [Rikenellaceae bacterium]